MVRLSAVEARKRLPDTLRRVEIAGERCILTVNGKDRAAIVPLEDLALLERLEDEADAREADAALAAIDRGEEAPLTLAELDRILDAPRPARKRRRTPR